MSKPTNVTARYNPNLKKSFALTVSHKSSVIIIAGIKTVKAGLDKVHNNKPVATRYFFLSLSPKKRSVELAKKIDSVYGR